MSLVPSIVLPSRIALHLFLCDTHGKTQLLRMLTPDYIPDKVEHLHRSKHCSSARLEYTNALGPTLQSWIESDLIWKRVGITRCDRWYVILIAIDRVHNLERGLAQRR